MATGTPRGVRRCLHRDRSTGSLRSPGASVSARVRSSRVLRPARRSSEHRARHVAVGRHPSGWPRYPSGDRPIDDRTPRAGYQDTVPLGVAAVRACGQGIARCTHATSVALRSAGWSASAGGQVGQDGNDRKATAAVMQYGCWRGEVFEGCEPRRGDCPVARPPPGGAVAASKKRGEPLAGCGVQQTRDSRVEKTVVVVRNHEGGT
jgi:hypothetical protein